MSELIISEQHRQAVELHQKIMISANLAQQNLFDMCTGLKAMRDNKLYRELGYSNFEDYCETEVGFNRTQAHKYISVIKNISESVYSSKHLGVSKLYLLSTISEPEQAEIAEKIDLESATVKQLKAEIDKLKYKNKNLEIGISAAKRDTSDAQGLVHETSLELERERKRCEKLSDQLDDAQEQIKELENRPIEVAVSEEDKIAKELVKTLGRQLSEADQEHCNKMEEQRKKYQQLINKEQAKSERLQRQLEELHNASAETVIDSKAVFRAYYSNVISVFNSMLDFINTADGDKDFFIEKSQNLINSFSEKLGGISNETL